MKTLRKTTSLPSKGTPRSIAKRSVTIPDGKASFKMLIDADLAAEAEEHAKAVGETLGEYTAGAIADYILLKRRNLLSRPVRRLRLHEGNGPTDSIADR